MHAQTKRTVRPMPHPLAGSSWLLEPHFTHTRPLGVPPQFTETYSLSRSDLELILEQWPELAAELVVMGGWWEGEAWQLRRSI